LDLCESHTLERVDLCGLNVNRASITAIATHVETVY